MRLRAERVDRGRVAGHERLEQRERVGQRVAERAEPARGGLELHAEAARRRRERARMQALERGQRERPLAVLVEQQTALGERGDDLRRARREIGRVPTRAASRTARRGRARAARQRCSSCVSEGERIASASSALARRACGRRRCSRAATRPRVARSRRARARSSAREVTEKHGTCGARGDQVARHERAEPLAHAARADDPDARCVRGHAAPRARAALGEDLAVQRLVGGHHLLGEEALRDARRARGAEAPRERGIGEQPLERGRERARRRRAAPAGPSRSCDHDLGEPADRRRDHGPARAPSPRAPRRRAPPAATAARTRRTPRAGRARRCGARGSARARRRRAAPRPPRARRARARRPRSRARSARAARARRAPRAARRRPCAARGSRRRADTRVSAAAPSCARTSLARRARPERLGIDGAPDHADPLRRDAAPRAAAARPRARSRPRAASRRR